MLGQRRTVAALRAHSFDFQAQCRTLFQSQGQGVQGASCAAVELRAARGEWHGTQVHVRAAADQAGDELERCLGGAQHQVAQGLPDDRHHAELRVVEVALDRQVEGDLAFRVLEQSHRQADRQVDGARAVDFLAQL
ncbi:hypothetical protein D9M68_900940 [compost metagenome]